MTITRSWFARRRTWRYNDFFRTENKKV